MGDSMKEIAADRNTPSDRLRVSFHNFSVPDGLDSEDYDDWLGLDRDKMIDGPILLGEMADKILEFDARVSKAKLSPQGLKAEWNQVQLLPERFDREEHNLEVGHHMAIYETNHEKPFQIIRDAIVSLHSGTVLTEAQVVGLQAVSEKAKAIAEKSATWKQQRHDTLRDFYLG